MTRCWRVFIIRRRRRTAAAAARRGAHGIACLAKRRQRAIRRNDCSHLRPPTARHAEYYPRYFPIIRFQRVGRVVAGDECLELWDWRGEVISKALGRSLAVYIIRCTCRNCSAPAHLVDIPIWWYRTDIARCEDRTVLRQESLPAVVYLYKICIYRRS